MHLSLCVWDIAQSPYYSGKEGPTKRLRTVHYGPPGRGREVLKMSSALKTISLFFVLNSVWQP
jgi:hypothetical protein